MGVGRSIFLFRDSLLFFCFYFQTTPDPLLAPFNWSTGDLVGDGQGDKRCAAHFHQFISPFPFFFFFLFGRGGLGDLCFHLGCQLLPEQGAPVGRKSISVESDFVMDRQDLPPAKSGSPWAGSAFCRHFLCQCDAVEEKVSGLRFFWGGVRRVVYRLIL